MAGKEGAPVAKGASSCAPGVAMVNIENGLGRGYLAGLINHG